MEMEIENTHGVICRLVEDRRCRAAKMNIVQNRLYTTAARIVSIFEGIALP